MVTAKKQNSELALVPEAVLKRRHDLDDLARKRAALQAVEVARKSARVNHKGKKSFYVIKPETILAKARSRRNQEIRFQRVRKKGMQKRASNKKVMATKEVVVDNDGADHHAETTQTIEYQSNSVGASVVFCIRIRDSVSIPTAVKHILVRLGLAKIHEGVFVRYDDRHRQLLQQVEPWVVYGPPTAAAVTDLIERRGYAKIKAERIPLSDNTVIENALGDKHNILCVEDLVHEIVHPGKAFVAATKFLWPFQLADSKTEFERRTLKMKDGKTYGDQGEAIHEYIERVL